ncbi:MAG: alkaline phosphatase family protein, partial [Clostridia bacterium]|nr:alkaline phosphatase family protein [Clostridia bacterium]
SVNPAISNLALATLVTGVSPYHTGITERGIKAPAQQDIFAYAAQKGKSVSYIEGNGNLILTSVEPVLNLPDAEGYTDNNVYNSAVDALEETDFLFVHFHGIDDVNHEYSPLSVEAKTKILEVEGYIESLVEDFDGTVIIVPDHGSVTVTNGDKTEGKHGLFLNGDMFVPYYVITRESA